MIRLPSSRPKVEGAVDGLGVRGAEHSLQRCRKQGAVHVVACKGAGTRVRGTW